jgi:spore maturation protein CgeB
VIEAPAKRRLSIIILGLSITSSWGNGHATTYRALVGGLVARGHDVLFLERDVPWYRANRDLRHPPFGKTELYESVDELKERWRTQIRQADLVVIGSYVPDAIEVADFATRIAQGVCAFYDIDTPVTVSGLARDDCTYLTRALVPRFDLYLSFTGGPILELLQKTYGARRARALYCSADPESHYPETADTLWDLGYLGTYSADRQPFLDALLCEPARRSAAGRFVVAGAQYPSDLAWPENVERIEHLPPDRHRWFYARQRFTLNITRRDMVRMGYSPSVRLFEAAACGVPIISDWWEGLDSIFEPGTEILIARSSADISALMRDFDRKRLKEIGRRARARVLAEHTASHRAAMLETYVGEISETSNYATII